MISSLFFNRKWAFPMRIDLRINQSGRRLQELLWRHRIICFFGVFFIASRPFGWAVWHSCRMGDRNQEQTRDRIGPQLQLGNLRVGELLFRPLVQHQTPRSSSSYMRAYVPGPRFRSVIRLDSLDPHCSQWVNDQQGSSLVSFPTFPSPLSPL